MLVELLNGSEKRASPSFVFAGENSFQQFFTWLSCEDSYTFLPRETPSWRTFVLSIRCQIVGLLRSLSHSLNATVREAGKRKNRVTEKGRWRNFSFTAQADWFFLTQIIWSTQHKIFEFFHYRCILMFCRCRNLKVLSIGRSASKFFQPLQLLDHLDEIEDKDPLWLAVNFRLRRKIIPCYGSWRSEWSRELGLPSFFPRSVKKKRKCGWDLEKRKNSVVTGVFADPPGFFAQYSGKAHLERISLMEKYTYIHSFEILRTKMKLIELGPWGLQRKWR